LKRECDLIQGTLERPTGKRLLTLTAQAAVADPHLAVYSIRHLPPIVGKGGVTQLVKWYVGTTYRRDERGEEVLFTGPTSLTYDSPSVIDPVHNLAIGQIWL
jgi:hypothetical protein